MKSALLNGRHRGESFKNYRARRTQVNRAIKLYLQRGKMVHESTRPTIALPLVGVDPQVDRAVELGQIRDLVLVTQKDGKQHRIGRSKGVSRVHPSKTVNPGMKRAERRKLYRRNEWRAAA